ncbi:MAG: hypothetical protein N3G48_03795 [Sulfolobales archaeon]|nr:hypothetical protein [Sulfolobales archaeon]
MELWSLGRLLELRRLRSHEDEVTYKLLVNDVIDPNKGYGWVVAVLYDAKGNRAITNPIRVYPVNSHTTVNEATTTTPKQPEPLSPPTTIIAIIALIVGLVISRFIRSAKFSINK